jgi:hypothetical protein
MIRGVSSSEKLFIGGYLNGHVGTVREGFKRVHWGFGYGEQNQEGEDILNFAIAYDLMVANTFFRKKKSHLIIFSSGQHSSQINFVMTRREGANDVYKMAKLRERKTRDFNQVKCIKDEADRLLVRDEEIKNRWRVSFDKLFNDESEKIAIELDDSIDTNRQFVQRIQESEVKESLKKMKTGKTLGPDDIPIEV